MRLVHSPDDNGYYWERSYIDENQTSVYDHEKPKVVFEVSKKVYPTQALAIKAKLNGNIAWEEVK